MVQLPNPRQLTPENNLQMQYAPESVDFDVADRTLSVKEQALLNTIRFAEGTYKEDGYRTFFGGSTFDDFTRHPDRVNSASGYNSAAAGGYQFMPDTWKMAQRATGVPDFSPVSQDAAALWLITKRRGVNPNTIDKLTPEIANSLAPEWASFPTLKGVSYYGQPNKKFTALKQFYDRQLKRLSK
jgi:lysozyme